VARNETTLSAAQGLNFPADKNMINQLIQLQQRQGYSPSNITKEKVEDRL
jgi:hypothetical protein